MNKAFRFVLLFRILLFAITVNAGQFPVPDTGQAKCYDALGNEISPCPQRGEPFYGQDGCYVIHPPSYTRLDGNSCETLEEGDSWVMIRDNVTGLIWEVKTDDGTIHDKDHTCSGPCQAGRGLEQSFQVLPIGFQE